MATRTASFIDFRLLSLCLMNILAGMEMDIFTPSFPEIMDAFSVNIEQVQLTLSVNFTAYALATLWVGPLAERFSSKNIAILSLVLFSIGSIFCCVATSFSVLLVGRLLQGLGMSGPNALSYAIVYEFYPKHRTKYISILSGLNALMMGAAPVFGSYLNLWLGWRSNFLSLLILSLVALALAFKCLPKQKSHQHTVPELGLKTYLPLFKSRRFNYPAALVVSSAVCYFVFVGIAPIFYREDLHVSLEAFGLYQGALASSYGLMCLFGGALCKRFGEDTCFKTSLGLYCLFGILAGIYGFFLPTNPLVLTAILIGWSFSCALPVNISYTRALGAVKGASARASGILITFRLVFSAIGLQIIAHFYNHTYFPLAVMIGIEGCLALFLGRRIIKRRY
ncbi:MAG: MFS transporter [Alphaproteobacteria bacterium]|nr:MFS transporter [Alphaproteobacteria bacterium]